MAFRQNRETGDEHRRFDAFARDNAELIGRLHLPDFVAENHREFIYFVEHGATASDAGFEFSIDKFDEVQRALYAKLLANYRAIVLGDPL